MPDTLPAHGSIIARDRAIGDALTSELATGHRRWTRLIPVAFVMYTIAYVDRTNLSLALPSIARDLHLTPTQSGAVAGVFFWGYLALQVPGGYLAQRWSAKRFITVLLVAWGICAVACGLAKTETQLMVARLLLGVSESGVYPAVLVLLANWFPRTERARANAYWMLCLPVAVVASSPVSGWMLDHWSWRVMLIVEGLLPFLWLVPWVALIDDHPHQAKWITNSERQYLQTTLAAEAQNASAEKSRPSLWAIFQWQTIVLSLIYFLFISAQFAYLFWLPSALTSARKMTNLRTGVLFCLPFIFGAIGMVLNSQHSDRTRDRRNHVAATLAFGACCLIAGLALSQRLPVLAFLLVSLGAVGYFGNLGPFWAIPAETLPKEVVGPAMGLINAIGNLGGYFGPLFVGEILRRTNNYRAGFAFVALSMLLACLLCRAVKRPPRQRDTSS